MKGKDIINSILTDLEQVTTKSPAKKNFNWKNTAYKTMSFLIVAAMVFGTVTIINNTNRGNKLTTPGAEVANPVEVDTTAPQADNLTATQSLITYFDTPKDYVALQRASIDAPARDSVDIKKAYDSLNPVVTNYTDYVFNMNYYQFDTSLGFLKDENEEADFFNDYALIMCYYPNVNGGNRFTLDSVFNWNGGNYVFFNKTVSDEGNTSELQDYMFCIPILKEQYEAFATDGDVNQFQFHISPPSFTATDSVFYSGAPIESVYKLIGEPNLNTVRDENLNIDYWIFPDGWTIDIEHKNGLIISSLLVNQNTGESNRLNPYPLDGADALSMIAQLEEGMTLAEVNELFGKNADTTEVIFPEISTDTGEYVHRWTLDSYSTTDPTKATRYEVVLTFKDNILTNIKYGETPINVLDFSEFAHKIFVGLSVQDLFTSAENYFSVDKAIEDKQEIDGKVIYTFNVNNDILEVITVDEKVESVIFNGAVITSATAETVEVVAADYDLNADIPDSSPIKFDYAGQNGDSQFKYRVIFHQDDQGLFVVNYNGSAADNEISQTLNLRAYFPNTDNICVYADSTGEKVVIKENETAEYGYIWHLDTNEMFYTLTSSVSAFNGKYNPIDYKAVFPNYFGADATKPNPEDGSLPSTKVYIDSFSDNLKANSNSDVNSYVLYYIFLYDDANHTRTTPKLKDVSFGYSGNGNMHSLIFADEINEQYLNENPDVAATTAVTSVTEVTDSSYVIID